MGFLNDVFNLISLLSSYNNEKYYTDSEGRRRRVSTREIIDAYNELSVQSQELYAQYNELCKQYDELLDSYNQLCDEYDDLVGQ